MLLQFAGNADVIVVDCGEVVDSVVYEVVILLLFEWFSFECPLN